MASALAFLIDLLQGSFDAELSGLKLSGALAFPEAGGGDWSLAPLAAAEGVVHAKIVDAQLLFDAHVTVPIRHGEIDFDEATVEHLGPDSRMGLGKEGLYVDAASGRTYLYQFPPAPVAGVEYERREALLGPWVSDRGKLKLREFVESLLRAGPAAQGPGFSAEARQLLDRTSASGEVRLGDGKFAAPGVQAELAGSTVNHNMVRLQSPSVGSGVTIDIASLMLRNVALQAGDAHLRCDEASGSLSLQLSAEGKGLRFALAVSTLKLGGVSAAGKT